MKKLHKNILFAAAVLVMPSALTEISFMWTVRLFVFYI